ncbi:MAG TPA: divergent polysaccharide deacetylase family protein [Thermohalobaculum sp.]|nr:divergent polysaccharide deacetylase family protein [Thermohalobaculum sp.]
MARSVSRRGGVGGYIKGFLFGIVLVVLVLVGLAFLAPVGELPGEGELTAVEDGEPDLAAATPELGDQAEAGLELVEESVEEVLAEDDPTVEIEGVAEEDLPVEEALEDVDPALGEASDEGALRPVELAELPGELPAGGDEALEPGGADEVPAELDAILDGVTGTDGDAEPETDTGASSEADQGTGDALASATPPPLAETRPIALDGPALEVNAASYAAPETEPVIGVIMDGVAGSELSPDVLFALPVAVTLGIVPGREGDEALAEAARARNWEVLAQLPFAGGEGEAMPGALSAGMPAEEIAERTEALMGRLSQAVAATSEGPLEDPAAVEALLQTLEAHGFGYVGTGGAAGEGPPNAEPTTIVPRDASAEEVLAVLQEAADEAGPGGASLVVLPPTRAAAEALARWSGEAGAGLVAPLSAVLRRQAGG